MSQYTLLNPFSGETMGTSARELTRNLEINRILIFGDVPVGIITHRDLVSFSRWCAGQVLSQHQTVPPRARAALTLVDRWLVDPDSVSSEELNRATRDTGRVAAWDVWAAVQTATDAANAAAYVAGCAVRTAGASAYADDVSFEAQAQWFQEHLRSAQ